MTAGGTSVLSYTIWMPEIDTAHAATIPVPTASETVITTPLIPGLEFHMPANTTITDSDGNVVNQVSITPIPVAQPPFPLPPGVHVPVYFTVQPGGGYIRAGDPNGPKGGWLVYPNTYHEAAGSRFDFWNYDAEQKGWYIYGHGSVSADRQGIVPDPGVVFYELTGAMVGGSGLGPGKGNNPSDPRKDGEPVDLGTGLFEYAKTDLYEPDVIPIALTRIYRQSDNASRAFGLGTSHPYDSFLVGQNPGWTYMDLVFADGSRIHFSRISTGALWRDAVLQSNSSPGPFFGATIAWNTKTDTGWTLTRRDGTVYVFPDSANATRSQQAALLSISDRNGNTLSITRDANANITQIRSPHNRWVQFTYDAGYRVTQATDNLGRTVQYFYDASGRLTQVTDANGGVWKYAYDANNNMTSLTDARNIPYLTNHYDANNQVSNQTQADNGSYQYNYFADSNGNITETDVTDPRGNVRRVTFNPPPLFPGGFAMAGFGSSDTSAAGTSLAQATTYQYQTGTNLLTSLTDPLGRTTSFTYDALGNTASITRLAGTPNAVTTSFTYEGKFSQPLSITDPLGHTTSLTYDGNGNVISVTDALGNASTFAYDGEGRVISASDPLGQTTQFSYAGPDLASITDPLGRSVQRFSDSAGRLVSLVDPLGHLTKYAYNSLNLLTSITDALGGVTSFSYDLNGNLLSVTDARNTTTPTTYTYDNLDRLATRKNPLLNQQSYQYDGNGNLTQFTDRRGKVTTLSYDALNRLVFAGFGTQPGPAYESTVSYTYDAGNRLTRLDHRDDHPRL